MELTPNTRLGLYEILGPLGAGGMGQVFRARDVKLGRLVALKVLRESATDNPAWLARFDREARLLATLSHPNIATIHGLDEENGIRYLVMELVPGRTFSQHLAEGPLPPEEALRVCQQIAVALEAAHERGVIHRDLKPANVMVTPEGKVKVLDFGLAKAVEANDFRTDSSAPCEAQTEEGVMLGTPAYMAPEQARGQAVDRRCDIWSFGCILYQALSGEQPFRGATRQDILAAVLTLSPAWEKLPPNLPAGIVELLRRCLQKDPQKRLRDAGDVRLELEEALGGPRTEVTTVPHPIAPRSRGAWRLWRPVRGVWLSLTAVVALTTVFVLGRWSAPLPLPPQLAPSTSVWSGEVLLRGAVPTFLPRVSPDGKWLAFIVLHKGQSQVGVMRLDSGEWWVLTHKRDRGQVNSVCWSRDSTRLYFDRYLDVPEGVYSASPLDRAPEGAQEVPVVKEADSPQVLSDGSLLVCKLTNDGNTQLHRWTANQGLRAVGPILGFERGWSTPLRPLHTRNEVVFCGKILDGAQAPVRKYYSLNLETEELHTLSDERVGHEFVALGVSRRDDYFYTILPADDGFRLVRLPLEGKGPAIPLLLLTMDTYSLDLDAEGRLYIDQAQRYLEVLRFEVGADDRPPVSPERLTGRLLWRETAMVAHPLELPDGGLLLPTKAAGRDRLVVFRAGKNPVPLLQDIKEETTLPAVRLGEHAVAFVAGPENEQRLRIALLEEGQFRLEATDLGVRAEGLEALAASPDGKSLWYVQHRHVFEVPVDGSRPPQKVVEGDAVAVDPHTGGLILQRFEKGGNRLFRLPRSGGPLEAVTFKPGPLQLAPVTLAGASVNRNGRILVTTTSREGFFWRPAVLTPGGTLQPVPVEFEGDLFPASWSKDGKVLGMGYSLRSELWRFSPHPIVGP